MERICGVSLDFEGAVWKAQMDWDFGKREPEDVMRENLEDIKWILGQKKPHLYRLVWPAPDETIDFNGLGNYYTWAVENYSREGEYSMLDKLYEWNSERAFVDKYFSPYASDEPPDILDGVLVEIVVRSKDISVTKTLYEFCEYPFDRTIVLKEGVPIEVIAVADIRPAVVKKDVYGYDEYFLDVEMMKDLLERGRLA